MSMKRNLVFEQGIIEGDTVRDILEVFPEIESSFRQRKKYDEYYYDDTVVDLTIEVMEALNNKHYKLSITSDDVIIS